MEVEFTLEYEVNDRGDLKVIIACPRLSVRAEQVYLRDEALRLLFDLETAIRQSPRNKPS